MFSPHPDVIDLILHDAPKGTMLTLSLALLDGSYAVGVLQVTDPGVVTIARVADGATPKDRVYVSRGAIVTASVLSY